MGKNSRNKGGHGRGLSSRIKEADRLFSILIRLQHVQYNGRICCYTCGEPHHFNDMECGHFIGRGTMITRWLEENCRPQCYNCNVALRGNLEVFASKLEIDHPGLPEQLKALEWGPTANYTRTDIEDHIKLIKKRIDLFGGLGSVPKKFT